MKNFFKIAKYLITSKEFLLSSGFKSKKDLILRFSKSSGKEKSYAAINMKISRDDSFTLYELVLFIFLEGLLNKNLEKEFACPCNKDPKIENPIDFSVFIFIFFNILDYKKYKTCHIHGIYKKIGTDGLVFHIIVGLFKVKTKKQYAGANLMLLFYTEELFRIFLKENDPRDIFKLLLNAKGFTTKGFADCLGGEFSENNNDFEKEKNKIYKNLSDKNRSDKNIYEYIIKLSELEPMDGSIEGLYNKIEKNFS